MEATQYPVVTTYSVVIFCRIGINAGLVGEGILLPRISGIFKKGIHYFSPKGLRPRFKWCAVQALFPHPRGARLLPGKAEIRLKHIGVPRLGPRGHIRSLNCCILTSEIPGNLVVPLA